LVFFILQLSQRCAVQQTSDLLRIHLIIISRLVITKNQPITARGQIRFFALKRCVHWEKPWYFQVSSVSRLYDNMHSVSR